MRLLVVLAAVLVAAQARSTRSPMSVLWQAWKTKYNKAYDSLVEETTRFETFLANAKLVGEHNLRYDLGLTKFDTELNMFADMSSEEFAATRMGHKVDLDYSTLGDESDVGADPPATQDWRPLGYVTPVKDQGQCGSCWSFSATGSLEGQHFASAGELVSLSEQQQVDCDTNCYGCNGGSMTIAFQWWIDNGGATGEADYPYTAADGTCQTGMPVRATLSSYKHVYPFGSETALQNAVGLIGPVSVAIDASEWAFQLYKSGVYDNANCKKYILDHGVLAVGYNSDDGDDYWIVKNSWGTSWGQEGYIWMARNQGNVCGIASEASYPVV